MASLKYIADSDFQTFSVGTDYTSGGASIILTTGHGARLPTTGDFWIRIDNEVFICTARSTDTLTVVGAKDGSSAANHSSGTTGYWVLSYSALNQLRADLVSTGTDAAKVSANDGRLYLPSDGVSLYRDTGSVLVPWGPIYPLIDPTLPTWSWFNQGGATISTTNGGIMLAFPSSAGNNLRGRTMTVPAAPYTATLGFTYINGFGNYSALGMLFTDGTQGLLLAGGGNGSPGSSSIPGASKYTNSTTFSANYTLTSIPTWQSPIIWVRVVDDNTNRIYYLSHDGVQWFQIFSVGRTDFLTPTTIGFGGDPHNSQVAYMTVHSWYTSQP